MCVPIFREAVAFSSFAGIAFTVGSGVAFNECGIYVRLRNTSLEASLFAVQLGDHDCHFVRRVFVGGNQQISPTSGTTFHLFNEVTRYFRCSFSRDDFQY
jgi:hypothetical protein